MRSALTDMIPWVALPVPSSRSVVAGRATDVASVPSTGGPHSPWTATDEAVARLAEFLPDRPSPFLVSVAADMGNDVQAALTAIVDNRYPADV